MNHEGATHLIGDLLHGRLGDGVRTEMLSHLRACRECRSLSETFAILAAAWEDPDERREHPPSDLVVRYALDEGGLEEKDRNWVASHVVGCTLCAAELEVTNEAETELAGEEAETVPRGEPRRTKNPYLAPTIAAALVLVVLAYPAYLGVFEVPKINDRIESLERSRVETAGPGQPGGAVHALALGGPVRSGNAETKVLRLPVDAPAMLDVDPGSLEEYSATGITRFAVQDAAGTTLWSQDLTLEQIRGFLSEGVVRFLIPARDLPSGSFTLSVSDDSGEILADRFVVERE